MRYIKSYMNKVHISDCKSLYEDHFTASNGDFEPSEEPKKGSITIKYCEEILEWLFYRTDLDNIEKYEQTLQIEEMIQNLLNRGGFVPGKINYIPTWSKKLETEVLTPDEIALLRNINKYNL